MSHNDLTVTYDNLEQIRMKFLDLSNQVADIQKPIQLTFQQLQSGGWSGKGAAAFFDQLDDDVLPTLRRMGNQFDGSANITKQLAQTFSNAENEASQLFKMGDSVEFSTKRLGGWFGGENAFSDKLSAIFGADQLSTHALGANAVFKKDYMRGMIKKHFSGEDDPKLNHAMESLLTGKNIEASLDEIARLRGVSRDEMQAQFEKYKRLLGDKDNAKELNLTGDHKNYLGSTWSMRFGKVVGDALGLDPVFGSLLSPAGGLVGAGNSGFQASDDNFIGYHGTFHDAGGYLLNTHGVGPGYDYLGEESFRASSNPLTGQRSGVEWWIQQSGTDIPYLPDALARNPLGKRVIGVGSQIYEAGTSVVQAGQGAYGGVKNIFKGNWSEAGRDFSSAGKNIAALPGRAIDAAVDNTVDLLKDAGGYIKDVGGAIGSLF